MTSSASLYVNTMVWNACARGLLLWIVIRNRGKMGGGVRRRVLVVGFLSYLLQYFFILTLFCCSRNLTWRDMQYLVIYSSDSNYPHDSHWQTNGAGLRGSHLYGFGILDSATLINRARNWITVPPRQNCTMDVSTQLEGNQRTSNGKPLTVTFHTDGCGLSYLEHVQAVTTLSMINKDRGSISIELTSPMGTKSTLLPYRSSDRHHEGLHKWPFMTVLTWGENPAGTWRFTITTRNGAVASLDGLELVFYGTSGTPSAIQSIPEQCHEQCSGKCAKAGAEFCDTCKNVRVATSHQCVEKCPSGTFKNMHMCRDCPDFCNECADDQICLQCQKGAVRLESGACAGKCPDLSYATINGNCIRCHHSCLGCDGPTERNCTLCPGQLSLGEDGTCSIRSPSSCRDGTYFDHRKLECISCHVTCAKCSGKESTQCTQCNDSYTLVDGMCIDNHQVQVCDSGYFFDVSISSCVSCPFMCANCSEDTKCLYCASNYYLLLDGTCVATCPNDTVTDNLTRTCLDTACHKSCVTCFGTKDNQCISCQQRRLLFEGSCVEKCPKATFETENICRRCHSSCEECSGPDVIQCLSCPDGTYLQGNRCVNVCPSGTFGDSTGVCLACPQNCINCSNSGKCTACTVDHFLVTTNNSCINQCPPGFATKASTRSCHPCLPSCIECSDPSSCQKCSDSFSYYEPNQSCLAGCPDGFFTTSENVCAPCKSPCSTCLDSPINCLACEFNFAMNSTSKTCERCCNSDTKNAFCCDCDTDDSVCVWLTAIPTSADDIFVDDGSTNQVVGSLFEGALIVTMTLILVVVLLVVLMMGIRYLRRRENVRIPNLSNMKLPVLNGSQKYTILPGNDNVSLELQDDSLSESETDVFDSKKTSV